MTWTLLKSGPLIALGLVLALGGAATTGYIKGASNATTKCELKAMQEIAKAMRVQEALADELEEERRKKQTVQRQQVRAVQREPDPSGCADVRIPDRVLEAINDATRSR
jgi:hypothetical protein